MAIDKAKQKAKAAKTKVADKVAKGKSKIKAKAKKVGAAVMAGLWLGLAVCGCATSEPASRATCASYGDIVIKVGEGARDNDIKITLGDGAIASADSTGSTETMTANPTNDVKPDIDVSVPVNKAGAGQSVGSVLGDAVEGLIKGTSARANNSTATVAPCEDGSCNEGGGGACADGSCNL